MVLNYLKKSFLFHQLLGDSEDEHFSSTEDEVSVRQEVSLFSTPVVSATSESSVTHADDKHVNISSEFERGCGCNKWCYEQFSVSETCDLRLSLPRMNKIFF